MEKPRKWTTEEITQLLDYLEANPVFEYPTAPTYYKELLSKVNINCSWDLLKWKVRNMRNALQRADNWRKMYSDTLSLTDRAAGLTTLDAKLQKLCPYYDRLNVLFNIVKIQDQGLSFKKNGRQPNGSTDEESSLNEGDEPTKKKKRSEVMSETIEIDSDMDLEFVTIGDEKDSCSFDLQNHINDQQSAIFQIYQNVNSIDSNGANGMGNESPTTINKAPSTNYAIDILTKCQLARNDILRKKIVWEEEQTRAQFELERRKLTNDHEIRLKELELKQMEIHKDERLQVLEIEKNERLARYELDLKYKTNACFNNN